MKFRQSLIPLPVAIVLAIIIAAAGVVAAIFLNASQSFIEDYVLLLAAAGITGFFIPYILKVIDDRKMREQKKYEDELSRQNKIIDAQVQFLESISKLLWEFHALIAKVSYYKKTEQGNKTLYSNKGSEAISVYEDKLWDIVIIGIQSEMSKSRRLVSAEAHQKLKTLYKDTLIGLDQEVVRLIEHNASHQDWATFHDEKLKGYLVMGIENTLQMLAEDMGLARQGSKSTP